MLNVAKKAYTVTLNDEFEATPKKQQELLKIIAKADSVYRHNPSFMEFSNQKLSDGREVKLSVCYQGIKLANPSEGYKISSIDFNLIVSRNNRVKQTYHISIFKNKSQRIVVHLPRDLFGGFSGDTKDSIKKKLNGEPAKIITNLLAKIFNDSSTSLKMDRIYYYATDYRYIGYNRSPDLSKAVNTIELNNNQETAMKELGWTYLETFKKHGRLVLLDEKRVYFFQKKDPDSANLSFDRQLSIAFASRFLETQQNEYP